MLPWLYMYLTSQVHAVPEHNASVVVHVQAKYMLYLIIMLPWLYMYLTSQVHAVPNHQAALAVHVPDKPSTCCT